MGVTNSGSAVEDALRAAAADSTSTNASVDGASETDFEDAGVSNKGKLPRDGSVVPRERLNEVLAKVKDLETQLASLSGTEKELNDSRSTAEELQRQLAQHQDLVGRIRSLADDDRYKDAVTKIDNALKGVEDKIEADFAEKEDAAGSDKKLLKELRDQKTEILDEIATERARSILQTAQDRAVRMLESLPEEYEEHRSVIAKLWNSEVDWTSIEENPARLNEELSRSFQSVLDEYPTPGNSQSGTSEDKNIPEQLSPEEELQRLLHPDLHWARANDKGELAVSEQDFNKVLAHSIRLGRQVSEKARGVR